MGLILAADPQGLALAGLGVRDTDDDAVAGEHARHADVHDVQEDQPLVARKRAARPEPRCVAGDACLAWRLGGVLFHGAEPFLVCVAERVGKMAEHAVLGVHERSVDELVADGRVRQVLAADDGGGDADPECAAGESSLVVGIESTQGALVARRRRLLVALAVLVRARRWFGVGPRRQPCALWMLYEEVNAARHAPARRRVVVLTF